jgi:NAD(P)-dependent dehydrogenase (short-subunit alcohol dehydrogenase family)
VNGPRTARFAGRSVVVTGGTRGIGRAIAEAFLTEGARVLITGRGESAVEVAARLAADHGREVLGFAGDVASEPDVRRLAALVKERFGQLDVLVNNAAIARRNRVRDISLSEWNKVMSVNLTGAFLVTRELLDLMRDRPDASIVNIASQAGKRGEALVSHYATSKAALIGLTRSLALELAPGLRVNAVCPGYIETDMILEHYRERGRLTGQSSEAVRDEMAARVPMGRLQSAESIAGVVTFLASDEARDMTGQAVNVTGGMVMD